MIFHLQPSSSEAKYVCVSLGLNMHLIRSNLKCIDSVCVSDHLALVFWPEILGIFRPPTHATQQLLICSKLDSQRYNRIRNAQSREAKGYPFIYASKTNVLYVSSYSDKTSHSHYRRYLKFGTAFKRLISQFNIMIIGIQ